jgi:hypothetical protein
MRSVFREPESFFRLSSRALIHREQTLSEACRIGSAKEGSLEGSGRWSDGLIRRPSWFLQPVGSEIVE